MNGSRQLKTQKTQRLDLSRNQTRFVSKSWYQSQDVSEEKSSKQLHHLPEKLNLTLTEKNGIKRHPNHARPTCHNGATVATVFTVKHQQATSTTTRNNHKHHHNFDSHILNIRKINPPKLHHVVQVDAISPKLS